MTPQPGTRLTSGTLSKLTSFMLGAAWALILIGAISAFTSFVKINFFTALLFAVIGAMPGLLIVLFLEYLILRSKTLAQMQLQTEFLAKILEKMNQD